MTDEEAARLFAEGEEISDDEAARLFAEAAAEPLPEGVEPESPFAKALKEQPGDVVMVETPTGPQSLTRAGRPVLSPEESAATIGQMGRTKSLRQLLALASGGDVMGFMQPVADVLGGERAGIEAQREAAAAEAEFPKTSLAGAVITTLPLGAARALPAMPGAGRLAGLLRSAAGQRVAGAGAIGAMGGAPSGEGAGETLRGAATGAVKGAAAQLAGEAIGVPLRAGVSRLGDFASRAADRVRQLADEAAAKAVAAEKGHLGRLVATQSLGAEKLQAIIDAPPGVYDPEVVAEAQRIMSSPEGRVMLNRVASNAFDKLREAFGAEPAQREALAAAVAASQPEAVAARAAEKMRPGALASDLAGRAWRSLGQRALLGAGGAMAGSLVGGTPGAGVGAGMGLIAPGALQMMRNVAKAPQYQWAAAKGLEAVTGAGADVAQYLTPGVVQSSVTGPGAAESRRNAYDALMQRLGLTAEDDEDLATKAFLAGQTQPAAQPGD